MKKNLPFRFDYGAYVIRHVRQQFQLASFGSIFNFQNTTSFQNFDQFYIIETEVTSLKQKVNKVDFRNHILCTCKNYLKQLKNWKLLENLNVLKGFDQISGLE